MIGLVSGGKGGGALSGTLGMLLVWRWLAEALRGSSPLSRSARSAARLQRALFVLVALCAPVWMRVLLAGRVDWARSFGLGPREASSFRFLLCPAHPQGHYELSRALR